MLHSVSAVRILCPPRFDVSWPAQDAPCYRTRKGQNANAKELTQSCIPNTMGVESIMSKQS